ncbi:MAG: hypothetical protein MUO38_06790 [Anaerolineales bacterium]|nr:hypothetical protein [Anaerolineales bacterium]
MASWPPSYARLLVQSQQQIPERKSNFDELDRVNHLRPVSGSVSDLSHEFSEQLGRHRQGWPLVHEEESVVALIPGFAFHQAIIV